MGNSQAIDYSIRAPYDPKDQRFVQSFDLNENPATVKNFYQKYGFVIFDNVLTEQEIEKSIDGLWEAFSASGAKKDDPSTWSKVRTPFGFAGKQPSDGVQLWDNRQNASIYKAFKMVYEVSTGKELKESLVACLDRGNIMLPTQGLLGKTEYECFRLPHFDLNPYIWCGLGKQDEDIVEMANMYDNYFRLLSEGNNTTSHGWPKLRAVLQLSESTDEGGGFECMAGFHNQLKNWCLQRPFKDDAISSSPYGWGVNSNDPIARNFQKLTCRKGSLIIFSAELPHSMFPNHSEGFRYAQYLRMAPVSTLELNEETEEKRKKLIRDHLPSGLEVTEIGREVFLLN